MLYRGDFPGFYAPAAMILDGKGAELYDFELQREYENKFWPEFNGEFYIYAYPPFVAVLLSPLALLDPITSKAVSTILLAFFALLALSLLAKWQGRKLSIPLAVLLLAYPPLTLSILGAQNTAVTMLLYVFSIVLLEKKDSRSHLVAGLISGFMLYKPQFGIFAILFFLVKFGRYYFFGVAISALTLYLVAVPFQGFDWPLTWPAEANRFGNMNFVRNGYQMSSLTGMAYYLLHISGYSHEALTGITLPLTALSLLTLVIWIGARERGTLPIHDIALLPLLTVVLTPQSLFYDLGWSVVGLYLILGNNIRFLPSDWFINRALSLLFICWLFIGTRRELILPVCAMMTVLTVWALLKPTLLTNKNFES